MTSTINRPSTPVDVTVSKERTTPPSRSRQLPWWLLTIGVALTMVTVSVVALTLSAPLRGTGLWWVLTLILHAPMVVILFFLSGGLVERLGYLVRGRRAPVPGVLPSDLPTVCVQVPMYNEHAVAQRVILAVGELEWPRDKLEIQILDDSTDPEIRIVVDRACATVASAGVSCHVIRRATRDGYKAGALEQGRHLTGAEFIAVLDADFMPAPDFLHRLMGHFYGRDGTPIHHLAMVQGQWGHLNHDESALTRAQSLWVDDHHTLQMSWRSAMWDFVNFTGTGGIWRASAIESVGGWKAASLVEDCELSFRHLFVGYTTKFVNDVVVPAELPATYTAYKAQQKRWTQGWVQVQRLHLRTLLTGYRTSPRRRLHLLYHMLVSWQWAAWGVWIMMLPPLIHMGLWMGSFGIGGGVVTYMLPPMMAMAISAVLASVTTKHTYVSNTPRQIMKRMGRIVPHAVITTGMLPHQFSAFAEGLAGPFNTEFERTPKTASVMQSSVGSGTSDPSPGQRHQVRIHWPYVLAEVFVVAYQLNWAAILIAQGLVWPAIGTLWVAGCVAYLVLFYGDNLGKVLFVIDHPRRPVTSRR